MKRSQLLILSAVSALSACGSGSISSSETAYVQNVSNVFKPNVIRGWDLFCDGDAGVGFDGSEVLEEAVLAVVPEENRGDDFFFGLKEATDYIDESGDYAFLFNHCHVSGQIEHGYMFSGNTLTSYVIYGCVVYGTNDAKAQIVAVPRDMVEDFDTVEIKFVYEIECQRSFYY